MINFVERIIPMYILRTIKFSTLLVFNENIDKCFIIKIRNYLNNYKYIIKISIIADFRYY